jgi:hypothetical protein
MLMGDLNSSALDRLLRLANYYPSPHNGQPIRLRQVSGKSLELFFETDRGLKAGPVSKLFSFVTVGVFARHFEYCATALGHTAVIKLHLPAEGDMASPGLLKLGTIKIDYDTHAPDSALKTLILKRQTSRKRYTKGLSSGETSELVETASAHKLTLRMIGPARAKQAAWLNQRAVTDDLFDPEVRGELDHWLRYTKAEKEQKRDGLAYDCMELSGSLLHLAVKYYKILHWPVVTPVLKQYYLRAVADSSSVGYLTGKFETPGHAVEIGRCIVDIWFELTRSGAFLHPLGTIISNAKAHLDFDELAGIHDETRSNYVVFIFRAGYSPKPVQSLRLQVKDHLLMEPTAGN